MTSKIEILNNLQAFSIEQIVEAINAGTVTLYELSKSGNLTPLMRRQIEKGLADKHSETEFNNQETESKVTYNTYTSKEDDESNNHVEIETTPQKPVCENPTITEVTPPALELETEKIEDTTKQSSFNESNKGMFNRPFSFKGRIRRTEYGISFLIYMIWYIIVNTVILNNPEPSPGGSMFYLITLIPMLWFLWAQGCKRCHDRGNSGWYQIIPFYFFVLLFGNGENGSNNYGDNPKQ